MSESIHLSVKNYPLETLEVEELWLQSLNAKGQEFVPNIGNCEFFNVSDHLVQLLFQGEYF